MHQLQFLGGSMQHRAAAGLGSGASRSRSHAAVNNVPTHNRHGDGDGDSSGRLAYIGNSAFDQSSSPPPSFRDRRQQKNSIKIFSRAASIFALFGPLVHLNDGFCGRMHFKEGPEGIWQKSKTLNKPDKLS